MIETTLLHSLGRLLDVCVTRHSVIASNLANIDTPGYRTRDINFRAALAEADGGETNLQPRRVEGLSERPDGNNVNLERETLLLAQNQLLFNAGVQVMKVEFHQLSTAINEGR